MLSMTGYGRGHALLGRGSFVVEIRSVNHRFLDLRVRLDSELATEQYVVEDMAGFNSPPFARRWGRSAYAARDMPRRGLFAVDACPLRRRCRALQNACARLRGLYHYAASPVNDCDGQT